VPKPKLIVVTGPPGAGKSSLAKTLAEKLQLALLSRDEIKRSLLLDLGCSHADAGDNINRQASERFFATVEQALARGNSLVVEAAFQHRLWSTWLPAQARIADSRLIICQVNAVIALNRVQQRLLEQPDWTYFHGDDLASTARLIGRYIAPSLQVPTLGLDTQDGYKPELETVIRFIKGKSKT
tara:strand:- start:26 stop:574 length:549 start_codon:yes stop_codon:yes gene_type:complete